MSPMEVNIFIFRLVNNLAEQAPELNAFFVFITSYSLYFLAAAAIVFFFVPGAQNRLMVGCAVGTVLLARLIRIPVGQLHSNLQPFAELPTVNLLIEKAVDNSFPSDHTLIAVSLCVTFALFQKRIALPWISLAVLIAVSRIWVGVHYPADVLVSAFIAAGAAFAVYRVVPKLSFSQHPMRDS